GAWPAAQRVIQESRSRERKRQALIRRPEHQVIKLRLVAALRPVLADPVVERLPDAAAESVDVGKKRREEQGIRRPKTEGRRQPHSPVPSQPHEHARGYKREHDRDRQRTLVGPRTNPHSGTYQQDLHSGPALRTRPRPPD